MPSTDSTATHSPSAIRQRSFNTYENYNDSGVEWIGEIPEHWEVVRNLGVFDERNERGMPDEELLSVTIGKGVIRQSEVTIKKDSSNEDKSKYKVLRTGDLAYNKMRAWQGAIGISDYNGIVSPAYIILKAKKKAYSKFFHYLFRSSEFIREANRLSYGLCDDMNSLRYDDFKGAYSPIPPSEDVDRIVEFLNRKTAEIDELIAKKQRQIKLLDELQAIRINNAVTKGIVSKEFGTLNPHLSTPDHPVYTTHQSKLVPSGIEWLGEIPEGWETIPIKRLSSVQTGITLGKDYSNASLEIPYLRVANVQNGHLNLGSLAFLKIPKSILIRYLLKKGDVLVAEGGDLDKLGRGCVWNSEIQECIHQNHVFAVRPDPEKLLPEFLSTALGSKYGQRYFMLTGKKTTNLASTNSTALMNFALAYSPLKEQRQIVDFINQTKHEVDDAIKIITSQLESNQELRNSIISHSVTGKIKV